MKVISTVYTIAVEVLAWLSLVLVPLVLRKRYGFSKKAVIVCSLVYLVAFLVVRIFFADLYHLLWGVILVILLVIDHEHSKWLARVQGKRWWKE